MRIQDFPESVFTISRNAYSHAPDSAEWNVGLGNRQRLHTCIGVCARTAVQHPGSFKAQLTFSPMVLKRDYAIVAVLHPRQDVRRAQTSVPRFTKLVRLLCEKQHRAA